MVVVAKSVKDIAIENLQAGTYQPRQHFDPVCLAELTASIKSAGMIQPLVVRPISSNKYEIIAGERRWRAAQMAQLATVPCLVRAATDEQAAAISTIENVNRVDLNPIEEASAYRRLLNEFDYSHDEVAAAVGKSRSRISNALRLLKLEKQVQQWLIDGVLTEGHGKMLASLAADKQLSLAKQTIANGWSVRRIEQAIKAPAKPQADYKDPDVVSLQNSLGDYVGCKVQIEHDAQQCHLHFASPIPAKIYNSVTYDQIPVRGILND